MGVKKTKQKTMGYSRTPSRAMFSDYIVRMIGYFYEDERTTIARTSIVWLPTNQTKNNIKLQYMKVIGCFHPWGNYCFHSGTAIVTVQETISEHRVRSSNFLPIFSFYNGGLPGINCFSSCFKEVLKIQMTKDFLAKIN